MEENAEFTVEGIETNCLLDGLVKKFINEVFNAKNTITLVGGDDFAVGMGVNAVKIFNANEYVHRFDELYFLLLKKNSCKIPLNNNEKYCFEYIKMLNLMNLFEQELVDIYELLEKSEDSLLSMARTLFGAKTFYSNNFEEGFHVVIWNYLRMKEGGMWIEGIQEIIGGEADNLAHGDLLIRRKEPLKINLDKQGTAIYEKYAAVGYIPLEEAYAEHGDLLRVLYAKHVSGKLLSTEEEICYRYLLLIEDLKKLWQRDMTFERLSTDELTNLYKRVEKLADKGVIIVGRSNLENIFCGYLRLFINNYRKSALKTLSKNDS